MNKIDPFQSAQISKTFQMMNFIICLLITVYFLIRPELMIIGFNVIPIGIMLGIWGAIMSFLRMKRI